MPKTLAEYLGVADPEQPTAPIGTPPPKNISVQDFCKEILATPQYREFLLRRILVNELPAAVECMLWHYGHGKPVEQVEVRDKTNPMEGMTVAQLKSRALYLADMARKLEERETETPASDASASGSVH